MSRILIVDDEQQVRTLVSRYLESKGHDVLTAENGEVGVKLAVAEQPELVLMDLNMPVMDGFTATAAIRAQPETQGIKILILSAENEEMNREAAYKAGCDGFINKPIDFDRLLPRLEQVLH